MTDKEKKPKTLAQKIIAVREAVTGVAKDGTNKFDNYNYASIAGVVSTLRSAMDAEGIVIIPKIDTDKYHFDRIKTDKGKERLLFHAPIHYTLINADNTEDCLTVDWVGAGVDPGERSIGKFSSYALKYVLINVFLLPTNDDEPDSEPRPDLDDVTNQLNNDNQCTPKQQKMIWAIACKVWPDIDSKERGAKLSDHAVSIELPASSRDFTKTQASMLIESLDELQKTNTQLSDDDIPF